ncbi:MAG: hypothetical protein ACRED4_03655 [Brevundimonas sp.]
MKPNKQKMGIGAITLVGSSCRFLAGEDDIMRWIGIGWISWMKITSGPAFNTNNI